MYSGLLAIVLVVHAQCLYSKYYSETSLTRSPVGPPDLAASDMWLHCRGAAQPVGTVWTREGRLAALGRCMATLQWCCFYLGQWKQLSARILRPVDALDSDRYTHNVVSHCENNASYLCKVGLQ